ncbi:MAG: YfiR/HmsC family protein [Crocinitomicaceae bacterium]|nr:YfiR/HmsC family protein [Crocinitomicaceae bacterium]
MELKKVILIVFTVILGAIRAQTGFNEKESIRNKQRVIYIYNFTDYITWPSIHEDETFRIGVLGSGYEGLVNEFNKTSKQKKVKDKEVKTIHYQRVEDVENVHILYVHEGSNIDLQLILPKMYANHTLLVSENYRFHESMINFIEFDNEFHFNVSEEKIKRAGLVVLPRLLNFSIVKQKDWEAVFERLESEKKVIENYIGELEGLSEKIEKQNSRLNAQNEQLIHQREEIKAQKEKLKEGQEELIMRMREVRLQRRQLDKLLYEIKEKNTQKDSLSVQLKLQDISYFERKAELKNQSNMILSQMSRIEKQERALAESDIVLDSRLKKIREQYNVIYGFLALFVLIVVITFFAYREYKRKRRSERRVKEQNVKLIALNDSLDSFVYRVSHDLKSPVINIKNMIGMLKEYQVNDDSSMVPEIMKNMDLSANRLEDTIMDLLELSRIEKIVEKKEEIKIEDVFLEMLPEFKSALEDVNCELDIEFKNGGNIYGAKVELVSIIQNLLTNSIKYRSKERRLKISVGSYYVKDRTVFIFEDNGKGLDLKEFDGKIFQMFQRFTEDKSISGTGVGMYIIKKLVNNNNGDIVLQGGPNIGLKYEISLPRKKLG